MSLDELILGYKIFLNKSWSSVDKFFQHDSTGSLKDDWLQANWELLVEGQIDTGRVKALDIYGEGADVNGDSSRILFPDRQPTHSVLVHSQNKSIYDYLANKTIEISEGTVLSKLVTFKNGWYYEKPPFNKVLVEFNGKEMVLDFEKVLFSLKNLD